MLATNRREFVATVLKGAAGVALSHRMARAEELSGGALTSTRLADNLMLISGAKRRRGDRIRRCVDGQWRSSGKVE
jgi:hypothetical protein